MKQMGIWLLLSMPLVAGCDQAMDNQPRYEAYEAAPQWQDNQSARVPVPGTVARGDEIGPPAQTLPVPLTEELLSRGRKQYEVFCTPCHGATGAGNGMVVQRGFPAPPSYHTERLRQVPLRHFYEVVSDGYGVMYSYGARVPPRDRWAIAAYIRALQLSQHAQLADLTEAQRRGLRREAQSNSRENEERAQ